MFLCLLPAGAVICEVAGAVRSQICEVEFGYISQYFTTCEV